MKKKQTPTKLKGRAPHWPTLRFQDIQVLLEIYGRMMHLLLVAAMTTRCYHAAKHVAYYIIC